MGWTEGDVAAVPLRLSSLGPRACLRIRLDFAHSANAHKNDAKAMLKGVRLMSTAIATTVIALFALSAPAMGQQAADPAAKPSDERRLSPQQVEQVLADAAARRASAENKAAVPEGDELGVVPPIYGEMGFGIGTGGYRSAYGSAVYPMGPNGSAAISLSFDRAHDDLEAYWDWGNRPPNR